MEIHKIMFKLTINILNLIRAISYANLLIQFIIQNT